MVPNKYSIESLELIDSKSLNLIINISRKFRAVGTSYKHYFIPYSEEDDATMTFNENKWDQKKFKDVQKTMAFLCYDQKMHKNPDGSDKVYTVCYEDRFMGIIETDVWRFHEEMEIPQHRVRQLKKDGEVIWDRAKRLSLI